MRKKPYSEYSEKEKKALLIDFINSTYSKAEFSEKYNIPIYILSYWWAKMKHEILSFDKSQCDFDNLINKQHSKEMPVGGLKELINNKLKKY